MTALSFYKRRQNNEETNVPVEVDTATDHL